MLFAITMLAILPEVSRAQCPPNDPSTGPDPWVGNWMGPWTQRVQLAGTNCWVTYTACSREGMDPVFGTFYATYIESVTPDPSSDCSGLAPDQMIKLLFHQMETTGSAAIIGPCTNGTTFTVTMASSCWEDIPFQWTDGLWYPAYSTCGNPDDYCRMDCQVCQNPDGTYNTSCTWSGSSNPACTPLPSPDLWQTNTCYDVEPCNGDPR